VLTAELEHIKARLTSRFCFGVFDFLLCLAVDVLMSVKLLYACVFEQNSFHAQKLLQDVYRYQYDNYLCDTVIVTDDGRLMAHSVILATASPVFRAALKITDRPTEHIVVIPYVTLAVMRTVLQFVYTGEIVPVPKDMPTVLSVLLQLKLVHLQPSDDGYATTFKIFFFCQGCKNIFFKKA